MKTAIRAITMLLLSCWLTSAAAWADGAEYLYVENSHGGDIYVLEIPSHRIVDRIELGVYLDDVTFSHQGDVLYANRIISAQVPEDPRVGETGEVYAISTATHEILWQLPVSGIPHHLTVSSDDRYLFVPIFNSYFLHVVDTRKRAVVEKIAVGYGPHGTQLSPDGNRLYVGTMFSDQLTVVDVATLKPIKRIPLEQGVRPFAITPDEKTAYVQLSRFHGFVVVDLEKDIVVNRVNLPLPTEDVAKPVFFPHTYNHGLALTPDGQYLFAAGSIADLVAVYSVPDLELLATIPVGRDPNWIVFTKDGKLCYVTNRGSDNLSVISVAQRKEIDRVKLGKYPQRMKTLVKR